MNMLTPNESEVQPKIKTMGGKKTRRKASSKGGFFYRLTTPYREWRDFPGQIRQCPAVATKNFDRIYEGLIDYRLALVKASHMAKNVNQRIWYLFNKSRSDYDQLLIDTNQRALFLHSRKYLRSLLSSWQELIGKQEELIDSIASAPASMKFYNMMMTYKEIRQQERVEDESNVRRYNEAYNSLELAFDYIEGFINKKENDVFSSSRVLNLEEARQHWSDKLDEIHQLQQSGKTGIDQILEKIDALKNIIFESPTMAKWINDAEKRFFRLSDDHDLLINTYGKRVIYADEMDETRVLMTTVIPKLWVTGDYTQLDYYLKQLDTFLSTNEPLIRDELAFEERHNPWAFSSPGEKGAEDIDMLISFVRIMINAIESREAHMGDHSITVARLAVSTAKESGWEEKELKYLEIAGLFHDVGKIWIPESLLTKPGPLTENEMQVLRMHPYYSAKIVESISALKEIVPWVYYHHERWDGKGYPEGLKQDEIPVGASIIAVAEAFSAMIFNTLSRKPLTIDQAYDQIRKESGKQFDPGVTDSFIKSAESIRTELEAMQKSGFSSPI